jgi:hypothetical protein
MIEIFFPILTVILLIAIAHSGRSFLAGILAGFPTVTAMVTGITLYIHGSNFVKDASNGITLGLLGTISFVLAYRLFAKQTPAVATAAAISIEGGVLSLIFYFRLPPFISWVLLPIAAILLEYIADKSPSSAPHPNSFTIGYILPVLMTFILVFASKSLKADVVGLLTPLPVTVLPFLLFVHTNFPNSLSGACAGIARGLLSTLLFSVLLGVTLPKLPQLGWWIAMLCAFILQLIFALALPQTQRKLSQGSRKQPYLSLFSKRKR